MIYHRKRRPRIRVFPYANSRTRHSIPTRACFIGIIAGKRVGLPTRFRFHTNATSGVYADVPKFWYEKPCTTVLVSPRSQNKSLRTYIEKRADRFGEQYRFSKITTARNYLKKLIHARFVKSKIYVFETDTLDLESRTNFHVYIKKKKRKSSQIHLHHVIRICTSYVYDASMS